MLKSTVVGLTVVFLASTVLPGAGQEPGGIQPRIEGFVTAFNSGDADTMLRFYEEALAHGGRTRAKNALPTGTRFVFTLPIHQHP